MDAKQSLKSLWWYIPKKMSPFVDEKTLQFYFQPTEEVVCTTYYHSFNENQCHIAVDKMSTYYLLREEVTLTG